MEIETWGWLIAGSISIAVSFWVLSVTIQARKHGLGAVTCSACAVLSILYFGILYFVTEAICVDGTIIHSLGKSMYFSVITLTHVGYGDLCPCTPHGEALAALQAVIGYVLLGLLVVLIYEFFRQR